MDSLTHTIITVGSLASAYYLGSYVKARSVFEDVVGNILDRLEKDGFIATKLDKMVISHSFLLMKFLLLLIKLR